MSQDNFVDVITGLVAEYQLPVELLRLEITESAFSVDTITIKDITGKLISAGFTVEIDDFGSGYSSLNTLKDVPASILKLDMRFFERTGDAKRGGNIVESVVRMSKWLGMAVIAEGVEDKAQADYLKSIGCCYIQGYLYAKPMPVEEYEKRLASSAKEVELTHLQTLQNLDNNDFWDSHSMDTLIFNSYVGAACILEYHKGKIELIRANDAYLSMLGTTSMNVHDLLELDWTTYLDTENFTRFNNAIMKSVKTKKSVSEEIVFTGVPGCPDKIYLITGVRAIAAVGDRILVYCLNNNITEQRNAEQQQLESVHKLEIVMNNVNGGVSAIRVGDDGTSEIVFNNEKYYELYGYTREQAKAKNIDVMRLILPEDIDSVMEKIKKLKQDKQPVIIDYRVKKRDGSRALLRSNASLMSLPGYGDDVITSVITDITEKRFLEDQLRAIVDNIYGAVSATYIDKDGQPQFLVVNDQFFHILGYSTREEYEAEHPDKYTGLHPDDRERIIHQFETSDGGKTQYTMNYRVVRKDGTIRYIRNNISVIYMFGIDSPVQLSVANDITEQTEAEMKERSISAQMQTMMANIQGGVTATLYRNEDAIDFVFANDGFYEMYGYTKEQMAAEMPNALDMIVPEDRKATMETVARIVKNRGSETYIYRCHKRDGSIIWVRCTNSVISIEGVGDTVLLGVSFDVTKEYEAEIGKSNALDRLNTVMNTMTNGMTAVAFHDNGMEFLFANNRFYEIYGIKIGDIGADKLSNALSYITPEYREKVRNAIHEAVREMKTVTMEYQIQRSNGTVCWINATINITKLSGIDAPVMVAVLTDITEQKNQEQLQRDLLDNLPFGAAMYEFDGKSLKALHINQQYQIMVGRTCHSANLKGYSPTDFIYPNDRAVALNAIKEAIATNRDAGCNIRVLYGEDEYRSFHIDARILAQPNGKYLVYASYTRLSEQELTFENALPHMFSTIMESSTDLAFAKDINFRYICCSKTFATLLGLESEQEVVGKTDYELFPKEIADMFRNDDSSLFATQKPQIDIQEMLPSPDGTKHYIRTSKHLMRSDTDAVIGIYCIGRDVTEDREAYARLRLLTDSIPGGIATFRCSPGKVEALYYNDGVCALSGYAREEYDANPVSLLDLIFEEDRPTIRKQIELMQSGKKLLNFTVRVHTNHGGYKWINGLATVTDNIGDAYIVNTVLTDVTKQQEEKERLRLAEEEYRIATEHSARTICRYNIADRSLTIANEAATRLALPLVLRDVPYADVKEGAISPDTANNYLAFFERILQGEKESAGVYCKKLNNRWRWLSARSTSIFDLSGRPVTAIISYTDITEAQEKELVYKKWKQSLTVKIPEQFTLYRCNLNKDASYDTKEGSLFGFAVDTTEHKRFNEYTEEFCRQYVMKDDRSKYLEFLDSDRLLAGYHRGVCSGELIFRAKLKEDDIRWIRLSLELLEYPDSTDIEAYLMYEDINDSVLEELHIKKQAETDSLTGLQNRKIFIEHVNGLIAQNQKDSNHALFLLDIDYFKHINDSFGHGVGDESIVSMADVILSVIGKDGFVCRLGGDEFLVYLPDMASRDAVADKARALCEASHITVRNDIQISVSIGVALVTDDGENFDSMYHKADKALYHVKGHGKNNFAFYDADMERDDKEVISETLSGSLTALTNGKNTMIVVDDSAINRMVHAGIFKNEFTIFEAENGQVALNYLRKHADKVAIVLLDIMMPVMDGYELLVIMKADPVLQEIPVIVISGEDDRKACLRAIRAGASEYIVKPVDADLLRLRVSSALSKSENVRLQKQNDDYAVDNQELCSYRTLIDSSATVLIEYSAKAGIFKYSPKTGKYLRGTFDDRPMWQILAEDKIATEADVETIRKMITESDKPCKATCNLMTPDGIAHPFLIKVILRKAFENDDVALITLTDRK